MLALLETIIDLIFALRRRMTLRFNSVDRQLDEIRVLVEGLDPNAALNKQVEAMIATEVARKDRLDALQQH